MNMAKNKTRLVIKRFDGVTWKYNGGKRTPALQCREETKRKKKSGKNKT